MPAVREQQTHQCPQEAYNLVQTGKKLCKEYWEGKAQSLLVSYVGGGALPLTTCWEAWAGGCTNLHLIHHLVHRNFRTTRGSPMKPPSYCPWPPEGVQSSRKQGLSLAGAPGPPPKLFLTKESSVGRAGLRGLPEVFLSSMLLGLWGPLPAPSQADM